MLLKSVSQKERSGVRDKHKLAKFADDSKLQDMFLFSQVIVKGTKRIA